MVKNKLRYQYLKLRLYKFLNKLGSTELVNKDASSWACKDEKGNYLLEMYKVGYRVSDAYTTYMDMCRPNQ